MDKGQSIDYGKLAYMQVEDLKRLVHNINAAPMGDTTLVTQYKSTAKEPFYGNYISQTVMFRNRGQSAVTVQITFNAEMNAEDTGSCQLLLNGIEAENRDIIMTASPQYYSLTFVVGSLSEGSHELGFRLKSSGGGNIYNVGIQLLGANVAHLTPQCNVSIIEQGQPYKISYGDGRYVKLYAMGSPGALITSMEREKYCTCAVMFDEGGVQQYDLLYFFVEEGSLYMTVYHVYTQADDSYTYFIDSDVSQIAAVKLDSCGAALCYTKGKDIYFSIISRSPGQAVPAHHYSAQKTAITYKNSAKPSAVSHVLGAQNGFAFCISGSDSSNIVYKSFQPRIKDLHSTMQLSIQADAA